MGQRESRDICETSVDRSSVSIQELLPVEHSLPEEVLLHILSYVDHKTLGNLRLVCHWWKHLIDKEKYRSVKSIDPEEKLPWFVYYWICDKDSFAKNLLENHCGQGLTMGQRESQNICETSADRSNVSIQKLLPEEVLLHILSYVDHKTLVNLRLVCSWWKYLIDNEVWRLKLSREKYRSVKSVDPKERLPWFIYYWICDRDHFLKNRFKNLCGQCRVVTEA